MYCGENSLSRHDEGNIVAVSLRCRSWPCPECGQQRKLQLIAQCHRGAPTTFLTLTLRRIPGRTPNQAALVLTRAWRLLRLRIMRRYKIKKLPFALVMEAHVSGYPHAHILLRSIWLDWKWLSEQMRDIADSPSVYIERIDHKAKINAYVAKYAGKCAHKFGTAKRYYFSRDYILPDSNPKAAEKRLRHQWDRQNMSVARFSTDLARLGYVIEWESMRAFTARPPPDEWWRSL